MFEKLGEQPSGTQCPAIGGIIKEAYETADEIEEGRARRCHRRKR
jgi:ferritin-like metal-binding protein YciE